VVPALSGKGLTKVLAGEYHSVAIAGNGEVYTWGCGSSGQLGHGDRSDLGIPKKVAALKDVAIVDGAAGGNHTLLLAADGRVFAFGKGRNGQLGRGDHLESIAAYRTTPMEVDALEGATVVQLSAGSDHSLALLSSD
jgi:alpha-tubulin suppressor-like RCC1 family protein